MHRRQEDRLMARQEDARHAAGDRAQTQWLMGLRRQARLWVMLAVVAPLLSGGLLLVQAFVLAQLLDAAITHGAPPQALLPAIALLAALAAGRALLGFAGDQAGIEAAETIKERLRRALFARLVGERPHWSAARPSGALAATIMDQVEALDGFFARFYPSMVQAAILPLAFAIAVLPVDWVAGLLFLVTAPAIPVFMALIGWGAEAANRAQAEAFNRLSARFADRLRGLLTLKLFGRAEAEIAAAASAGEALRLRTLRVLRIAFLSSAVLEFFAAIGVAGVALYIGLTYLGYVDLRFSPLSLQGGLFCLLLAPEVYQPLRLLAANYHDRAQAKAAAAEIAQMFGGPPVLAEPEIQPAPARPATAMPALAVETRGLSVYTPDNLLMVVSRLDLAVAPGDRIAVFGESGAGKSTLLEALAGLREFYGEVLLGGRRLQDIDETGLRASVALIGQRPRIFHGTIAENIALGAPGCSQAELREAARLACVGDFADALPAGLDTMLGENGFGVSGGEAHRIALARLYLRRPGLILLDEPTAHLDAATEQRVLDGLGSFAQGRTLICVTHSPAVIARMDRAYRLAAGRLFRAPARTGGQRSAGIGVVA
jgi:ATP-binding cassette, subfamily C, bacterial CydD